MHNKVCKYCGSSYQARRSNSLFCSTSCRVQYGKINATQCEKAAKAAIYIQELLNSLRRFPETVDNVDELLTVLQEKVAMARLTLPQLQKKQ